MDSSRKLKRASVGLFMAFSVVSASCAAWSVEDEKHAPPDSEKKAGRLPELNIDASSVTVSGLSSGAFMAVQLHVAHSGKISGVAAIAGGPYWCASGDAKRAERVCMNSPSEIEIQALHAKARAFEKSGSIDALKNLSRSRVYIFSGRSDTRVRPAASEKLVTFYRKWVPERAIQYDHQVDAGHGLATENYGVDCQSGGSPFLLRCGVDSAGILLAHLYGKLQPKRLAPRVNLVSFDQTEFGANAALLYNQGSAYIPSACRSGAVCRLHLALHGCQQSPEYTGRQYDEYGGFNEWAEANNIVVIYPKTRISSKNPFACWDWFGYAGENYATREGAQVQVLNRIIDRLISKK